MVGGGRGGAGVIVAQVSIHPASCHTEEGWREGRRVGWREREGERGREAGAEVSSLGFPSFRAPDRAARPRC